MPVVVNCTKCQKKLKIPDELLGKKVKCPTCSAVFTAEASEAVPEEKPAPKPVVKKPPVVEDEDDDVPAPKPKRKPVVEDEDDEEVSAKPSKRKVVDDDDDEDEAPKKSSKRKADDDEDEDDAPKKKSKRRDDDDDDDDDDDRPSKKRRRSGGGAPHRGTMLLIFGIVGILCCPIFAILAAIFGHNDLKAMDNGDMDESGRSLTNVARILGFVGIGLWILGIIGNVVNNVVR